MALTSEEVVQEGALVVEHVNRLSEQMVVYQQRLDGLTGMFDEMTQSMDQRENEMTQAFDAMETTMRETCLQQSVEMGNLIENSIKAPCAENLSRLQEDLDRKFIVVSESNSEVIERWAQWRDSEIAELTNKMDEENSRASQTVQSLNEQCNDDIELIETSTTTFIDNSSTRLEEMEAYVQEATTSVLAEQENYRQAMLESFSSSLEELMNTTFETLNDTQRDVTEANFNETAEQFSNMVKAELIPLIDQLVQEVSDAIDEMLEAVTNIGENSEEKSKALDAVTDLLEQIIQPIKDTINRTQSIHDVVGGFI